jgi:hypothetical protein
MSYGQAKLAGKEKDYVPTEEVPRNALTEAGFKAEEKAKQRTVTRTGTVNGRKVIQYSDGTVEYGQ